MRIISYLLEGEKDEEDEGEPIVGGFVVGKRKLNAKRR